MRTLTDFWGSVGNKSSSSSQSAAKSKNEENPKNEMKMDISKDTNKRKPSPKRENEKSSKKKYPKQFNEAWGDGREWLVFDKEKSSMFCDWCKIIHGSNMPENRGTSWVTTGCTRFQLSM